MKLSLQQIVQLHGAVSTGLNGRPKAVGESVVMEEFDLTGKTRMDLACNKVVLAPFLQSYTDTRNGMIKKYGGSKKLDADSKLNEKFQQEATDLLLAEHSIDLNMLTSADLKLDINPINIDVIAALTPIITDKSMPVVEKTT